MQKGMHKMFDFPIKCESALLAMNSPQISEINHEIVIWDKDFDPLRGYDAFDQPETIPALIYLVEKIKNGGNQENLIIKWVQKWGPLKSEEIKKDSKPIFAQSLGPFLSEAFKFYDLWILYRAVANKDLDTLKEIITVFEDPNLPFDATHMFYFFETKHYNDNAEGILDNQNPLRSYQNQAMLYLMRNIEKHINPNMLGWSQMYHHKSKNEDFIKFKPAFRFNNLLDALYMQFFILLTENTKKICPVCNSPFLPERKDKKYCSDTCKFTAKSQRYRNRKALML